MSEKNSLPHFINELSETHNDDSLFDIENSAEIVTGHKILKEFQEKNGDDELIVPKLRFNQKKLSMKISSDSIEDVQKLATTVDKFSNASFREDDNENIIVDIDKESNKC